MKYQMKGTHMKAKKFVRGKRSNANVNDDQGTVSVLIYLREGNGVKKGNITKRFSVHNAKVSEVFAAIDKSLFE